ncbi:hypothetical protein [Azospirillum oleiclasticum]|nr:hypothetical protein [Azospirillum oleiclasticum]
MMIRTLSAVVLGAFLLSGCSLTSRENRALTGGAVGAAGGAVVGAVAGGSALVGGLVGGAAGAAIGALTDDGDNRRGRGHRHHD